MSEESDTEFLTCILRKLVNVPDRVLVSRSADEMGVLMSVSVAPEDMGIVIGRGGATAKAIRTLMRIVGMKNGARISVRINEPGGLPATSRKTASDIVRGL